MQTSKVMLCLVAVCVLASCDAYMIDQGRMLMDENLQNHPYRLAEHRAFWADREGKYEEALEHWLTAVPYYENSNQLLTKASLYKEIGEACFKAGRVGDVMKYVDKLEAALAEVDAIGLENLDDVGKGYRINEFAQHTNLDSAETTRQNVYLICERAVKQLSGRFLAEVGDHENIPEGYHANMNGLRAEHLYAQFEDSGFAQLRDDLHEEIGQGIKYTKQSDPRAVKLWDEINLEVQHRITTTAYDIEKSWVLSDGMLELIRIESLKTYTTIGCTEQSIEIVKGYIKEREGSRSSLSAEGYKRGFHERNLELYETYIAMTTNYPGLNLTGMEWAKSRAMLDLMAGGVEQINNPKVQEVVRLQQLVDDSDEGKKRGIVLQGKLEELEREYPEYYTLVSTDVADRDQLASVLSPDVVALSYYVTEEFVYINVLNSEVGAVNDPSSDKIGRVVKVPLAERDLKMAAQQFRERLMSLDGSAASVGATVSVEHSFHKHGIETVLINNSPVEVEVEGMWVSFKRLHGETDRGIKPYFHPSLVDRVLPGKRERIKYFEFAEEIQENQPASGDLDYVEYHTVDTNLGKLEFNVKLLGKAGEIPEIIITHGDPLVFGESQVSLYDVLIKPVEDLIAGKNLVIVPHGVLHSIPFGALQNAQGEYLIEKHAISYAPSLNTLKLVKEKARPEPARLVAYADTLGDLFHARTEVGAIQGTFSESVVIVGSDVTREAVDATIGQGDIIHFACHGVFDRDAPLDSGLVLSSSSDTATDLLTVTDIMGMQIDPALVFLSACDTGRAEVSGGDEIVGLTRGFFVSGAPSVINTLWAIDDRATSMLAQRFYKNMLVHNMDKAAALREAKLHLAQNGFESPYYWGAFVLHGDWN